MILLENFIVSMVTGVFLKQLKLYNVSFILIVYFYYMQKKYVLVYGSLSIHFYIILFWFGEFKNFVLQILSSYFISMQSSRIQKHYQCSSK